jgi:flagellar basal-body rod modification protein FlgD
MNVGAVSQGGEAAVAETPVKTDQVNQTTFLKLLVAQLRHQNPLDPADGAAFVGQLATFSQLEQSIGMREELAAIREALQSKPSSPSVESGT